MAFKKNMLNTFESMKDRQEDMSKEQDFYFKKYLRINQMEFLKIKMIRFKTKQQIRQT